MSTEKWRWRSSTISLGGLRPVASDPDALPRPKSMDPAESNRRRAFSKALRSLGSSSSLDSVARTASRKNLSARRMQKSSSGSGSGSVMERIHRRVSRGSSSSNTPSESPSNPSDRSCASMEILRCGWLKADNSLLKIRSEYLVLTDYSLVKFGSAEAARCVFPQLGQLNRHSKALASPHVAGNKFAVADVRFEIPLRSIVAIFSEDFSASRFSIEVWWFSQSPKLAYCRAHLYFALPKERNDWLAALHQAHKTRMRKNPVASLVPENIRLRVHHAIQLAETTTDNGPQQLIFPVAKRNLSMAHKGAVADESQSQMDGSSFYLVIGPYLCYFIEILSADLSTPPGDLRMKAITFGTVTLTRFQASVASHEQRFSISFRSPFGRENRLDLASVSYRRIIETLTKVDRVLKPMWPQNLQRTIFQIKGLPPPLQLTSGNDLGGLELSLHAYCIAFKVPVPSWTIEWNTPSQPEFRLLPLEGVEYAPLQLIAVFRSLRYNSFFKAISFRDVSLSSLAGKKDYSQYGDVVTCTSLSGVGIPEEHFKILLQCTVLEQEIHALMFASESIRSVDFTMQPSAGKGDPAKLRQISSEVLSPILMLLRRNLCHCHSISMSGNLLAEADVDELANLLNMDEVSVKKLELSRCGLADAGLTKLWSAMAGQANSLEWLDISDNHGTVKYEVIRDTLAQFRRIKYLNISGSTRIVGKGSLFFEDAINEWTLKELNLSNITLNDATINVIAGYLETPKSMSLQVIRLNNSRLTGDQIARLFRSMGQARKITVHMNSIQLDDGIDDLCRAIGFGFGPWSLFMQMVEFHQEMSYVKFLRALTVNKSIECLSLAGTATSEPLSKTACQAVSDFFANNDTVRFLDISGYVSKLDEGRLGREFSNALSGLRTNTRIEHLRVRSQMLNFNIGDLAEAIADNKTLHTLDCEGNNFNLSNFIHLVKHLERNKTIRHFSAFSEQELAQIMQESVDKAEAAFKPPRSSVIAKFRPSKGQLGAEKPLVQRLQNEWDATISALYQALERNQSIYEKAGRPANIAAAAADGIDEGTFSSAFEGLVKKTDRVRRTGSASSPGCSTPASNNSSRNSQAFVSQSRTPSEESTRGVLRSNSALSSNNSINARGSGVHSGKSTPPEMEYADQRQPEWIQPSEPEGLYNDLQDDAYYYIDDDAVLQVGTYGHLLRDLESRIDEEEDKA